MIEEKKKPSFWGGPPEPCYRDTETGHEYRRFFGGMAWPDSQPGFIVIVGEEFDVDNSLDEHKCSILAEYQSPNPSDLIRRCKEYEGIFKVDRIFGNTQNRPMMEFIRNGKVEFYLADAPLMDDSTAAQCYLSLIREVTSATKKVLSFGGTSMLPGILAGADHHSASPAVLALGYVLAALRTYSPRNPNEHLLIQPEPVATY